MGWDSMMRQRCVLPCLLLSLLVSSGFADPLPAKARQITRAPAYLQGNQQYFLLLLGRMPPREIWLVRDGLDFYIDRNANGDLTEAGEKITVEKPKLGQFIYVDLGMIHDAHGEAHGPLKVLVTTNPGEQIRVDFSVAKKFAQVARFVPARTTPESACVLHFDGPLATGFVGNVNGRIAPLHKPEAFALSRSQGRYLASWVGTQLADSPAVYCRHLPVPENDQEKQPRIKMVYDHRDPGQPPIVETLILEEETPDRYSRYKVRAPMNAGAKAKITLLYPTLPNVPAYEIEVKVVD